MGLKYEFYINAGLEEVWNALISPDGTRNSFFGTNFAPISNQASRLLM